MAAAPRFCPHSQCPTHRSPWNSPEPWYIKAGWRHTDVVGPVQKFRCKACGRGFSTRTFDIDYWTHRTIDYHQVQGLVVGGAGLRQAGRLMGVSLSLLSNRHQRLARQGLALHSLLVRDWELKEDLVFDGFESFAYSQYFPNHLNLLATADSQFVVALHAATFRRKGRMTALQKERRRGLELLWRPDSKAIFYSSKQLFHVGCQKAFASLRVPLVVRTDEHPVYPSALKSLRPYGTWLEAGALKHQRTNSKAPRSFANPLFAVNYLDRQLRKDMAEHVRESVRFARRIEFSLERAVVHLVHHNYFKVFRVNGTDRNESHAERAGVQREMVERLREASLRVRAFGWRLDLEPWALDVWRRQVCVPILPVSPLANHLRTA